MNNEITVKREYSVRKFGELVDFSLFATDTKLLTKEDFCNICLKIAPNKIFNNANAIRLFDGQLMNFKKKEKIIFVYDDNGESCQLNWHYGKYYGNNKKEILLKDLPNRKLFYIDNNLHIKIDNYYLDIENGGDYNKITEKEENIKVCIAYLEIIVW